MTGLLNIRYYTVFDVNDVMILVDSSFFPLALDIDENYSPQNGIKRKTCPQKRRLKIVLVQPIGWFGAHGKILLSPACVSSSLSSQDCAQSFLRNVLIVA